MQSNPLHLALQAVVRLHFHATGDKPVSDRDYDVYVDTLVALLERANDQAFTLTKAE